ncbi:MAG: hypothetical protein ACTHU0_00330 [Kofleriaceae bacterium]
MKWFAMFALALAAGCGGSDSPVDKCDDLVDQICDRAVDCVGLAHGTCVADIQSVLPCGRAVSVKASYDRCMDQLSSNSCAALFPPDQNGNPDLSLPADCQAVIQLERTAAPPSIENSSPMQDELTTAWASP